LLPLDPAWLDRLHLARPDLSIIAEADGSAMRPFKAPGEGEPVMPAATTTALTVVGLDVLGRPLDERAVHRPERVAALTGALPGAPVTAGLIAAVLAHPAGGGKDVPSGARRVVMLNKAETPERVAAAELIAARVQTVTARVVISQLKREPAIRAVYP
jgi:probable selenium-dependent hydroxylase accessory protein YqeC